MIVVLGQVTEMFVDVSDSVAAAVAGDVVAAVVAAVAAVAVRGYVTASAEKHGEVEVTVSVV